MNFVDRVTDGKPAMTLDEYQALHWRVRKRMRDAGVPVPFPGKGEVWGVDRISELRACIAAGHTATQIGKEMNLSRCSIMGKAHRLGLSIGHGRQAAVNDREKRKRVNRAKGARVWQASHGASLPACEAIPSGETWQALPGAAPVALVDLQPGMCRWPIDPHPVTFCGAEPLRCLPYCGAHAGLAYRPTSRAE